MGQRTGLVNLNRDWIGEVLKHIDQLVDTEAFDLVDDLFSKAPVDLMPLELSVGYLLATASVKQELGQRTLLFQKVQDEILRQGLQDQGLLNGLE
jgi:hypothetical protein